MPLIIGENYNVKRYSVFHNFRFNELAWTSLCSDAHPNGIIAGGTEDGTVVFFDADKFIKNQSLEVLLSRRDHHGHVLTIDVSRDGRYEMKVYKNNSKK